MKKLAFDIYFAEDVYRNRWESWTNSLGYFCINMTIKCTSIFGIEHNERVYIGKQQDAKANRAAPCKTPGRAQIKRSNSTTKASPIIRAGRAHAA